MAVAPLGLLLSFIFLGELSRLLGRAVFIGFCLGLIIESLQLFLVSGITLGVSVITRVVGVTTGAAVGYRLKRYSLWPMLYLIRPMMPVTGVLYVLLLIAVVTVGKGPILPFEQAIRRLNEINYMPFFYHYYTSESAAMTSLIGVAAMFFPIGVQYWVWRITQLREFIARGAVNAGFLGWMIGTGLEICKLFFTGARPDPTNLLIAASAAAAGFVGASICTRASLSLPGVETSC
jgi:hypothetical protein